MKKYGFLLFFLLVSAFSASYSKPRIYDLNETIQIAVKNNYDLQLSEAQITTAASGLRAAFGSYLPSINLSAGYDRVLSASLSPNSFSMGGAAGLTLFDGFSREAQYASAKEQVKVTDYTIRYNKQYVIYQTYMGYINLIRNWQIVKIRRENLSLGKTELEMIKARYSAGVTAIDAVYTQEADLGNRESQLISAENDFNISKATLLTLMGLDPTLECEFLEAGLPTEITPADIENFRQSVGGFSQSVSRALENRYDYKLTESKIAIAEQGIRQAYSSYSPSLSADLNWGWFNNKLSSANSTDTWRGGLSLQVPIFNNFKPNNAVQHAKYQLTSEEINQKKVEQGLKQAIQTAFLNLDASEKQIEVSVKTVISAQQNYDSMKERMNVGAASTTDLTLANTQLITAQINAVNAVYGYIFSQKGVLFSIGDIK
jgi:outer membrane protein